MATAALGQSAIGFGFALFAVPLLAWAGVPLHETIVLVATCSTLQAAIGAHHLRHAAPWRLVSICVGIRMAGVVAGMIGLTALVTFDPVNIRMTVGLSLCLLVAVQMLWKPRPSATIHWGWATLSFLVSGLLSGLVGMGGPPLILWAVARANWSSQKTRGFLFSVFVVANTIQIGMLFWTFGSGMLRSMAIGAAFAPIVYAASRAGLALGNRIPKERLKVTVYLLLLALGLNSAVPPLLKRLRADRNIETSPTPVHSAPATTGVAQ